MDFSIIFLTLIKIAVVVILHELGHYIAFRYYGIKPRIKLLWWGVQIGEYDFYRLIPFKAVVVLGAGIFLGMIPFMIFFFNQPIVYFAMCSMDIASLISISTFKQENKNLSLWRNLKMQLEEVQEKLGDARL